ncbi:hypothetical protein ILUMI_06432 [Ignelater luminosus]|uniref:Uncharacterized protein n=1 Tax=Ignelater luminosus TaxID=2038154 RepID=A0A8K0DAP5_IGNLU|nr:hypothetical protein ILUMI_06432 [Ignelater luminosus]
MKLFFKQQDKVLKFKGITVLLLTSLKFSLCDNPAKKYLFVQYKFYMNSKINNKLIYSQPPPLESCERGNDPQSDVDPESEILVSSKGFPSVREVQVWSQQVISWITPQK